MICWLIYKSISKGNLKLIPEVQCDQYIDLILICTQLKRMLVIQPDALCGADITAKKNSEADKQARQ